MGRSPATNTLIRVLDPDKSTQGARQQFILLEQRPSNVPANRPNCFQNRQLRLQILFFFCRRSLEKQTSQKFAP